MVAGVILVLNLHLKNDYLHLTQIYVPAFCYPTEDSHHGKPRDSAKRVESFYRTLRHKR